MRARFNAVPHRDTLIEDKTFAAPQACCRGYCLQILQDTATQLMDLLHTYLLDECGGFLAANASGAKHGHPRLLAVPQQLIARLSEPGRKVPEAACFWIDCADKRSDRDFISVARVDDDRIRVR